MDTIKPLQACKHIVLYAILTFFFVLCSAQVKAQNIDKLSIWSLWDLGHVRLAQELKAAKTDSVKFKILIVQAQLLDAKDGNRKADIDSAFHDLDLAAQLARKMKIQKWDSELYQNLGALTMSTGDIEKSKSYFMQAIKINSAAGDRLNEAKCWFEMAYRIGFKHGAQKLEYLQHALDIYQSIHHTELQAKTLKEIADTYLNLNQCDLAEKKLLEVLALYRSVKFKNLHYTYDLLSAVSRQKGDINKTLYYSNAAVQCAISARDTLNICIFYWRLADAYADVGNMQKSIAYYEKAYHNGVITKANTLYLVINNLTPLLIQTGQVKRALQIIKRAAQVIPAGDITQQKSIAFSMGDCYMALGDYNVAEKYYTKYPKIVDGEDDVQSFWIKLCRFYLHQKDYVKAENYVTKLLNLYENSGYPIHRRDIYLMKFKIDSAQGKAWSAIDALQKYNNLKDSIFNADKVKLVEELQVKFSTADRIKDIQLLKNRGVLQDKKLQNENLIKNIVIGSCGVLFLFLLLLFNRYQIKNNANNELKKQQELVVDKNHMLELTIGQKTKLVNEKEFLLKEIHHRVKNNLQLTMSLLNSQCYYLTSEDAVKAIRESEHRLKSIALVHQKLYQGDHIDRMDLRTYILEIVSYLKESFTGSRNVHFETRIEEVDIDVSQAVSIGLFVNEAITNIFKYAFTDGQAGLVQVLIRRVEGARFEALIKDNGKGLPNGFNIDQQKSLGFILMKGLSNQLGGKLLVYNDNGTSIGMTFMIHPLLEV